LSEELIIVLRLLLAAVLGGAIGYQRERTGKPAGLRTHMLICIGAALFTVVSIYAFEGADPSRVAAQIVTGIGFLGAGAIIFRSTDGLIAGLTTAATMWVVAGIGVAVGSGLIMASVLTTVIVLIVLFIPHLK
jgi:putative Mg2+ transporter-C (MgtC) family protein